ncbi:hypothetical protein [Mucilaginibacter agri]|uniref:Uncharacterized protein n=1 Tax=Mucilaginibacter agri TaxID=2695265 RepID=A0A966DTN2_9SPHI|nr:hypothetical protein [Mucilaginibacter agri]NCD69517.1 hypothetical protein [Mucilaginibacter agri]
MTLISMINGHGFPVIISDRAISEAGNKKPVILPSTNKHTSQNTPVIDFNVKTIIIQDVLCVAFAGNVTGIKQLQADISDYFLYRRVNKGNLKELLGTLKYNDDVSVLFAIGGPEFSNNQIMVVYKGNWLNDQSRENLDVLSCGSGAEAWTKHLVENSGYLDESEISVHFCKQRALLTCISFLNQERQSITNLMDGWGGGFDVVYYDKGVFHRFDQLTYAFHVVKVEQPTQIAPISLIHNSYQNGNAIVRHLTADGYQNYLIPQFNERFPRLEEDPNCISRDIVTCIRLLKDGGSYCDLVVLIWDNDPQAAPYFYTTRKDNNFGVLFSDIYIKKVREAISSYLA